MSKLVTPSMVRVLDDFYDGGRLLYKSGNLYPTNERLELLKSRGQAEDFVPEKVGKSPKAVKAGDPSKPEPVDKSSTGSLDDGSATAVASATAAGGETAASQSLSTDAPDAAVNPLEPQT